MVLASTSLSMCIYMSHCNVAVCHSPHSSNRGSRSRHGSGSNKARPRGLPKLDSRKRGRAVHEQSRFKQKTKKRIAKALLQLCTVLSAIRSKYKQYRTCAASHVDIRLLLSLLTLEHVALFLSYCEVWYFCFSKCHVTPSA